MTLYSDDTLDFKIGLNGIISHVILNSIKDVTTLDDIKLSIELVNDTLPNTEIYGIDVSKLVIKSIEFNKSDYSFTIETETGTLYLSPNYTGSSPQNMSFTPIETTSDTVISSDLYDINGSNYSIDYSLSDNSFEIDSLQSNEFKFDIKLDDNRSFSLGGNFKRNVTYNADGKIISIGKGSVSDTESFEIKINDKTFTFENFQQSIYFDINTGILTYGPNNEEIQNFNFTLNNKIFTFEGVAKNLEINTTKDTFILNTSHTHQIKYTDDNNSVSIPMGIKTIETNEVGELYFTFENTGSTVEEFNINGISIKNFIELSGSIKLIGNTIYISGLAGDITVNDLPLEYFNIGSTINGQQNYNFVINEDLINLTVESINTLTPYLEIDGNVSRLNIFKVYKSLNAGSGLINNLNILNMGPKELREALSHPDTDHYTSKFVNEMKKDGEYILLEDMLRFINFTYTNDIKPGDTLEDPGFAGERGIEAIVTKHNSTPREPNSLEITIAVLLSLLVGAPVSIIIRKLFQKTQ